jgi:hypothetical protein
MRGVKKKAEKNEMKKIPLSEKEKIFVRYP